MQLHILAIGKARAGPEKSLCADYLKRLPFGGRLSECESRLPEGLARQKDESQKLLSSLPAKGSVRLVALDPKGKDISSEALAKQISSWREDGVSGCYFAIGGADGHDATLLAKADATLSFGRAIWPHMLFRVMLAEQLYRAEMILKQHPYHRG